MDSISKCISNATTSLHPEATAALTQTNSTDLLPLPPLSYCSLLIYSAEQLEKLVSCLNEVIYPSASNPSGASDCIPKQNKTKLFTLVYRTLNGWHPTLPKVPLSSPLSTLLQLACYAGLSSQNTPSFFTHCYLKDVIFSSWNTHLFSAFWLSLRPQIKRHCLREIVLNIQSPQPHYLSSFYCYFPSQHLAAFSNIFTH